MSNSARNTSSKARLVRTVAATAAAAAAALAATGSSAITNSAAPAPVAATTVAAQATQTTTAPHAHPDKRNSNVSAGVKTRWLKFDHQNGLNVSYTYNGQYSIGARQTWQGVTSTPSTPSGPAVLAAHGSVVNTSQPVTWFDSQLATQGSNPDEATNGTATGAGSAPPTVLTYAFDGTLTINGTSYNVTLGHASDFVEMMRYDQWWIGGMPTKRGSGTWTTTKSGGLVTPDGKYEILPTGNLGRSLAIVRYPQAKANNMDFTGSSGVNVSYTYKHGHMTSAGQTWGGVFSSSENGNALVTAYGDTTDTAAPAQWFTQSLEASGLATSAAGSPPADMYFAFDGDLMINGKPYPIVIGEQGTSWLHFGQNYWWVGGANPGPHNGSWATTQVNGRTALVTPDAKYLIEVGNNCHTFKVVLF